MTSKDELREEADSIIATINSDPNTSNYLDYDQRKPIVDAILNLLEGEKQEDKRLPFTQIKFSNDMVATVEDDGKTLVIATRKKGRSNERR